MTLINSPLPSALRDPAGEFIPPGSMHKRYTHDPVFDGEPVPSWITAGGTTTLAPTVAGAPYPGFEVSTDTATTSNLAFGPDMPRTPFLAASAITLRGVRSMQATGGGGGGGRHSVSLRFSSGNDDGNDRGASLISQGFAPVSSPTVSQEGSTRLRAFFNGNVIEKPSIHRYYNPVNGGEFQGVTMSLLVHWQLGMVYAFEGDFETGDCVNVVAAPGILRFEDELPVRPRATISHRGASGTLVSDPLRIGAVQVDHWFL